MNSGDEHLAVLTFLNMFGAELIDKDLKVKANSPEMIKGLKVMADLYKEGVLPTNYATMTIDEVISAMQPGAPRWRSIRSPATRSTTTRRRRSIPGQIKVVGLPADPDSAAKTRR